jgi:hypothetical protein
MSVSGISAMIFNRIADFLSEVWSIRIARSRAIRRRRESLKLMLHNPQEERPTRYHSSA